LIDVYVCVVTDAVRRFLL